MNSHKHIPPKGPEQGKANRLKEDQLLAYLEGKLPPDAQHDIEMWLADEGMENDALEGLQGMTAPERNASINKLNSKLKRTLAQNKKRRKSRLKADNNILMAVFIILILTVAAYYVIRHLQ